MSSLSGNETSPTCRPARTQVKTIHLQQLLPVSCVHPTDTGDLNHSPSPPFNLFFLSLDRQRIKANPLASKAEAKVKPSTPPIPLAAERTGRQYSFLKNNASSSYLLFAVGTSASEHQSHGRRHPPRLPHLSNLSPMETRKGERTYELTKCLRES